MLLNTFFSDAILSGFYLFVILSMCIVRFLNGFKFFFIDIVYIQT